MKKKNIKKIIIEDVWQMKKITEDFTKLLCPKLSLGQEAVVVGLSGELGSGKTTFTQNFAKALGIKGRVTSPTFVILKRYVLRDTRYKYLIHIDAYRIKNPKEIFDLGWDDLISDPKNIILIEWAENIKKIFPKNYFWLKFRHIDEKRRAIDISYIN